MRLKSKRVRPMRIEKKVIHGQEVEVKIYPTGESNYEEDDELEELLKLMEPGEPTVNATGREFYLKRPED